MTAPRVLVFPSQELPLVSVSVYRKVGATVDPAGKEGLGRFTARLMRRTGGGMSADQLDERIDALGAALGVDSSHSVLSFHGTTISRSVDGFEAVLADIVGRPGFGMDELARLRRETEAEIVEGRDNDRGLARRWFRQKLFEGHPYARSASGTIASIRGVSESDVREHYQRTFQPENLLFSLSGDIDEARAHRLVSAMTERLPRGPSHLDEVADPELPKGRRLVIVDKPERTQTQILIGALGTHAHDPDHVPLMVANTIFGGTFTARLSREVRSKRGWSYGAYSSLTYDRRRRAFSMWTFPKAEEAAPCISLQIELLERLVGDGVTRSELESAKRYLTRSHAFAIDTAAKRAALAADQVLYDLPPGYHDDYVEHVRAVTLEDVNAAIKNRLAPNDLLVVVVGTEGLIGDAVRKSIPGLASTEIVPYDGDI